ncbi:helix-turn-helix transcriptional regulator [Clostridium tertium]|uniref:helix-turn-helix domain-containing protein n=1 Tax=Clostridium tertium TaxID=1559 RepID=UPI00232DC390|nr:helix-turn-helix transcriptional regulator [Clostridium tertium]MDB1924104.1 helix-turn-helix transcriptional regulator [Clostridium tertium]MDB1927135.1 helix-turn-helix transcriptional regulator [Clostridium tertium]MDB1930912.1 helix-turn-helix transcriptional regulator [Clostridium tertium]
MKRIGKRLKQLRLDRNMTQQDLANKSNISRNTISDIESNAHANTTIFVVCNLCRALGITPNDLIPEEMYK